MDFIEPTDEGTFSRNLAEYFDIDLIDDALHCKRFSHLNPTPLFLNFETSTVLGDIQIAKPVIGRFLLLGLVVTGVCLFGLRFSWSAIRPPQALSVQIVKPPTENPTAVEESASKVIVEETEEESDPGEPELEQDGTTDQNTEFDNPIETTTGPVVQPDLKTPLLEQLSQVVEATIVQQTDFPEAVDVPTQNGLQAPGVVVDGKLRERLASPWVEKLNRRRTPVETTVETIHGTLTKLGDLCVITNQVAIGSHPMDLPWVGNGANVSSVMKVDCDEYFKQFDLKREDVKSPTTTPPSPIAPR